jgi:putative Mg2+ transporter-C (MgtC) family protein
MDTFFDEIKGGIADSDMLIRIVVRLVLAAAFGSLIGWERRRSGHFAGLRTHMLVCLGATVFTLTILESRDAKATDLSRVIQGIVTGIGFLGAGAILKMEAQHQVKGLTTAADIWVTAGIGIAVGAGFHAMALLVTLLTWCILDYLTFFEQRLSPAPTVAPDNSPMPRAAEVNNRSPH